MITKVLWSAAIASCFGSTGYAQLHNSNSVPIEGMYSYLAEDSLSGIKLDLKSDGSFKYFIGSDLQTMHSYGTWKLRGDTVIINSAIDAENIPITIKEKRVDSLKNRLTFDLVKNLDGDIMGALLYFNKDTTLACDPLTSYGCDKKVGSVKSVKVEFTKEASTKWYKIKSKKTNFIEIVVGVHDLLALYIFTKNDQYLYKDGTLLYLSKDNTTQGEVLKKVK